MLPIRALPYVIFWIFVIYFAAGFFRNDKPAQQIARYTPIDRSKVPVQNPAATHTYSPAPGTPKPPLPIITHISTRSTNPHICEKPEDAFYAGFPPDSAYGSIRDQILLSDGGNSDSDVTWPGNFKGIVPVCFLIDLTGKPTDLKFPQPPPPEIEEHLRDRISGWVYQPEYFKDKPIRSEIAFNFVFR